MTPTETRMARLLADATGLAHDDAAAALNELSEQGVELVGPGDLLGVAEAAELLGRDRTTVSRWKAQGYLTAPLGVPGGSRGAPAWARAQLERFRVEHEAGADASGRRTGSAA